MITDDKDFGFHAIREARDACGVLLLRLPLEAIADVVGRVLDVISTQGSRLEQRFTVVEPGRARSRQLPTQEASR